jgi:cytochrome P450
LHDAELRKQIRKEVADDLDEFGVIKPGRDWRKWPTVECLWKEVNRLHPGFPIYFGYSASNLLVSGVDIPAGLDVFVLISAIMQDEKHFSRAKGFCYERWMTPRDEEKFPVHSNELLTFGFGAHTCPGRHIAKMETCLTVAMLASRFKLSTTEKNLEWFGAFVSYPKPFECTNDV